MLNDKEKLEYNVLTIINEADGKPLGCGSLAVRLQALGYSFSEATVGRILRDLDISGLTERAGFQGRKLSEMGTGHLISLAEKDRRLRQGAELLAAVQGHTREQLLEVLIARRAIEGELAALAAENATPEEIRSLKSALDHQQSMLDTGDGVAAADVEFHSRIVQMAKNRVLAAAIALIRQDTQLSPVLEHIRFRVRSLVIVDHQKIAESIESGKSEKARAAMTEHINNLIADVEKYWSVKEPPTDQPSLD